MERFICGSGVVAGELCNACGVTVVRGGQDALVEAWVVHGGCETQVFENGVDELVPIARAATQALEGFL